MDNKKINCFLWTKTCDEILLHTRASQTNQQLACQNFINFLDQKVVIDIFDKKNDSNGDNTLGSVVVQRKMTVSRNTATYSDYLLSIVIAYAPAWQIFCCFLLLEVVLLLLFSRNVR